MPTLHFKGKSIIRSYHLGVKYHPLTPDVPSLRDSLPVLKTLLPYFVGRAKCVYIDPPFENPPPAGHYGQVSRQHNGERRKGLCS